MLRPVGYNSKYNRFYHTAFNYDSLKKSRRTHDGALYPSNLIMFYMYYLRTLKEDK